MEKRILKVNYILMICAMVCLVCYDIFGGLWLKGVTSGWFVLLGGVNLWCAWKQGRKQLGYVILVEIGLIFGMCADVLLGMVFFAGVGVFALGHVLYLVAFYTLEKFSWKDLLIMVPFAAFSIFMVAGSPWVTVEDPFMKKLLLGYALVISAMIGKAISNLICKPSLARWLVVIGSILFWFSDLMLAIDMFGQSSRLIWILCSYSYWPAQNLLAHSLCPANRE